MTSDSEPIQENIPTPNAHGKADIKADDPIPDIHPATSVPCSPPSKCHYEITCKTEKNWWDKFKPFVEIFGVILLALYTRETFKIYCANQQAAQAAQDTLGEIQKQTKLFGQQLEATQAAVVIGEGSSFNFAHDNV